MKPTDRVSALMASSRPVREHRPDCDEDLEAIVLCCPAKAPADRFSSAAALADELASYLAGDQLEVQLIRRRRRQLALSAGPLLAAVALAVAVVAFDVGSHGGRRILLSGQRGVEHEWHGVVEEWDIEDSVH